MNNANIPAGMVAITPSDSAFVNIVGLTVGVAGTVACVDSQGTSTTLTMVAGQTVACRIIQVKSTGTTATSIVGFVSQ